MKVEHIAFNVKETEAMSAWYCGNLGMQVVHRMNKAIFLADETGHGIIEIYNNPVDDVPEYTAMDPLQLHLAFQSSNLKSDRERLMSAGASPAGPEFNPEIEFGIVFLKDPWGFTIQFVRREQNFLP
ncbi:MAG: VOC family protein [Spirochaetales bacterium]|jgi:glyoxylase I family protein|nr:VOC family protein [Spirochaetales bacterium]